METIFINYKREVVYMILFLFCLGLVVFLCVLMLIVILSSVKIKIHQIYNSETKRKELLNKVSLYLLGKIKIFEINVKPKKVKNVSKNKKSKKVLKYIKKDLKVLKYLHIDIEKLKLELKIGTENVVVTSMIATAITSIISYILAKNIKHYKKENYEYKILPIYNKNIIDIYIDCIINVKIVHIMYVIYILIKKRREEKYERTSNRRSYDYSYEQH